MSRAAAPPRRARRPLAPALLAAILAAADAAAAAGRLAPGDHERRLEHAGRERRALVHVPRALVHVPRALAAGVRVPLLLAFHGGGGNAEGFAAYAGLDAVAEREGFVVAYPDGSGRLRRRLLTWNAGGCCGYAMREDVDDVGFVRALLDDLARVLPLDASRVYATGHSNGGMFAHRLAAEAADRIAAVVSVAGATPLPRFAPPRPVAVLHVHSVDDPRALYAGGLGPPFPFTRERSMHEAVEARLARWVAHDGCAAEARRAETRSAPALHGSAVHRAERLVHAPCRGGVEVALWRLHGPGHGWPGAAGALPERLIGPETRVIDAAEEIWRFVRRFSLPEAAAGGQREGSDDR